MYRSGSCEGLDTLSVTVHAPAALGIQASQTQACEGDTIVLAAPPGFINYQWSTGETGQSIAVTASRTVVLTAEHSSGCPVIPDTVEVVFHPVPLKPSITVNGNILTATVDAAMYRWYLDGNLLQSDTSRSIVITRSGVYEVEAVSLFGCATHSDPVTAVGVDRLERSLARTFSVAPNPGNGEIEVALEFTRPESFALNIYNTAGQVVFTRQQTAPVRSFRQRMDIPGAVPGLYLLVVRSGDRFDYRKVIVQ